MGQAPSPGEVNAAEARRVRPGMSTKMVGAWVAVALVLFCAGCGGAPAGEPEEVAVTQPDGAVVIALADGGVEVVVVGEPGDAGASDAQLDAHANVVAADASDAEALPALPVPAGRDDAGQASCPSFAPFACPNANGWYVCTDLVHDVTNCGQCRTACTGAETCHPLSSAQLAYDEHDAGGVLCPSAAEVAALDLGKMVRCIYRAYCQ